jgi:CMP-N-acetylneuraminic acid synthetase
MVVHTIDAARATGLFDRIVVSTEDAEVAEVTRAAGAEVLLRPDALADDHARVLDVCLHALDIEQAAGRRHAILCCLYATAPLRNACDISATVGLVETGPASFALAVTEYGLPPHQALRVESGNMLEPMWSELINCRGDEVPALVVDNGSTYAVAVDEFRRQRSFYGSPLAGHRMPRNRSVDIDTADDFELALFYGRRAK